MSRRALSSTPRKVAKMEEMPDWALRCHAWGHPWRAPIARRFSYWGFDSILALYWCTNCHSLRRDVRERARPRVLTTRLYRHPHDYLAAFPARVPDYRDEWFARFEAPPDDALADDGWLIYQAAA